MSHSARGNRPGRHEIALYDGSIDADVNHDYAHELIAQGVIPRDKGISEETQAKSVLHRGEERRSPEGGA